MSRDKCRGANVIALWSVLVAWTKTFNLHHNLHVETIRDRTLIFFMCIPCTWFHKLWPWSFTHFWKTWLLLRDVYRPVNVIVFWQLLFINFSCEIPDDRNDTFLSALKQYVNPNTQLAMCILPTNRKDRYDAIKKFCCVDHPGNRYSDISYGTKSCRLWPKLLVEITLIFPSVCNS